MEGTLYALLYFVTGGGGGHIIYLRLMWEFMAMHSHNHYNNGPPHDLFVHADGEQN